MKLWSRWVALLDRHEDPLALAVCRVIAAGTVAHHLAATWWSGAWRAIWVDVGHGGMLPLEAGWMAPFGGWTPGNASVLLAATLLASLLLACGLFTRVAAVAAWLGFRTLVAANPESGGSYDELLVSTLLLLALSGAGGTLSLDARFRGRRRSAVPAWPRYVLIVQLVLMYWMTGLQKVSAGWLPFGSMDALWYILQQPTWHRFDMRWMAPLYPLTRAATVTTWVFEQTAPGLLLAMWFRHTASRPGRIRGWFNRHDLRTKYLAVGLALHLGIFVTMEVGAFLGAVLALYACCFSPPEWRAAFARVAAARGRGVPARTSAGT